MTDTIHKNWRGYSGYIAAEEWRRANEAADAPLHNNELREQVKKLTAEHEQQRKAEVERLLRIETIVNGLKAENEALRVSIKTANDQAEEFERKWYLRGDELEALRVSNEKLTSEFRKGCKECAREKQARADNKEWKDGVKRGGEIVAALVTKENQHE